ncbi:MAG TPA: hypothetical protein DD727_09925, partial [Clostridiales bacterium]|nr:hypothetical protein [Clostridiales bacterium]
SLGTAVVTEKLGKAEEIKGRILAGEDAVTLAKQYSQDPSVSTNGGVFKYNKAQSYDESTGQWSTNQLVAELRDWGINAAVGDVGIVTTQYGFHVMKLEARETSTLESVKSGIIDEFAMAEVEKMIRAWLETDPHDVTLNTRVIDSILPIMK